MPNRFIHVPMQMRDMVGRLLLALLVVLLLPGCTDAPLAQTDGDDGGDAVDTGGLGPPGAPWRLDAPVLEAGRSWTYVAAGVWEVPREVTIVVARADADGYLFAGATREDLLNEIAWDLPYFGPRDRLLAPVGDADAHSGPMFVFPLEENATWGFRGLEVTARRAEIEVDGETVDGVRITGDDGTFKVLVEYAPQVGYVTRYEEVWGSLGVAWSLVLTATGTSDAWTWAERAAEVFTGGLADRPTTWDPAGGRVRSAPPAALEVTQEDDTVVVWWTGAAGSRGTVLPPAGGPALLLHEGRGGTAFRFETLDAVPGTWRFTGAPGGADGWAYYQGHAIRWLGP